MYISCSWILCYREFRSSSRQHLNHLYSLTSVIVISSLDLTLNGFALLYGVLGHASWYCFMCVCLGVVISNANRNWSQRTRLNGVLVQISLPQYFMWNSILRRCRIGDIDFDGYRLLVVPYSTWSIAGPKQTSSSSLELATSTKTSNNPIDNTIWTIYYHLD